MTNEQREAIEYLKDMKNNQKDLNKSGYVYANEKIDTVLSLIKEQEKQIDLMAKFIENNMSEKKIINEICIKSKCNNEECHEDDLKDCIKQYFANKVNSKIQ